MGIMGVFMVRDEIWSVMRLYGVDVDVMGSTDHPPAPPS